MLELRGELDISHEKEIPECSITRVEHGLLYQELIINHPDNQWKSKAIEFLTFEFWSESDIVQHCEDDVISVDIDGISPHVVDTVIGDGHCLFRALSKAITGTQANHLAIRKAVVQWMLHEEHPRQLASFTALRPAVLCSKGVY